MLAVQARLFSFLDAPNFLAHRVVNHADDDFALESERNRNAEVGDSIEIIHSAVQWIDNPFMLARLVADDSFFAIKRVLWKLLEQKIADQLLRLNVDREFDVVCERGVDVLRAMIILPNQFTGFARGAFGCVVIML